jgi:hypothetical protein
LPLLFFVLFFAAFFVVLLAPPFLLALPAFFAVFFAAFLEDFLEDFLVAFLAAPRRACFLPALFFVALPAPLRAPLDVFDPFLAAILFAPLVGLGLGLTVAK